MWKRLAQIGGAVGVVFTAIRTVIWWAGDIQTVQELVDDRGRIVTTASAIALHPLFGPAIVVVALAVYFHREYFSGWKASALAGSGQLVRVDPVHRVDDWTNAPVPQTRQPSDAQVLKREALIASWREMVADIHTRVLANDFTKVDLGARRITKELERHQAFITFRTHMSVETRKAIYGEEMIFLPSSTMDRVLLLILHDIDVMAKQWCVD